MEKEKKSILEYCKYYDITTYGYLDLTSFKSSSQSNILQKTIKNI